MTTTDILLNFIVYLDAVCYPDCMFTHCEYIEQWHKSQRSGSTKCTYTSKLIMVYNPIKLVIK